MHWTSDLRDGGIFANYTERFLASPLARGYVIRLIELDPGCELTNTITPEFALSHKASLALANERERRAVRCRKPCIASPSQTADEQLLLSVRA
ncbi:hypothetical protein J2R76_003961 [Bradyrhizobium sp. USDA 4532]|uniref:hypothetical protein n=1 Tax=unclassified Bradyrhizobium TaxID=2631580 RepID=UPI00209C74EF|nr:MULTISPECIES: hypothetical protein [unclassified Bradyrhizobium]MCP1835621.1 hypothetical protein [Bradyrhizobium sp. USDA 4545]MCP1920370.1 hypothetical protein [Bradyrhizobium sp. USDA 4532]